MKQPVSIKSFPNGISIILDNQMDFEQLYVAFAEKFRDSAKFFGNAKMVVSFENRELSELEERALVEAIEEYTNLTVLCVSKKDGDTNQSYIKTLGGFRDEDGNASKDVYKGSIHAGQHINTKGSLIILGDVNPSAIVEADGSIVVLGTIYGSCHAGFSGDESSFVAAIDIKTTSIAVADMECHSFIKSAGFLRTKSGASIVHISEGKIMCNEITKEFISKL